MCRNTADQPSSTLTLFIVIFALFESNWLFLVYTLSAEISSTVSDSSRATMDSGPDGASFLAPTRLPRPAEAEAGTAIRESDQYRDRLNTRRI